MEAVFSAAYERHKTIGLRLRLLQRHDAGRRSSLKFDRRTSVGPERLRTIAKGDTIPIGMWLVKQMIDVSGTLMHICFRLHECGYSNV